MEDEVLMVVAKEKDGNSVLQDKTLVLYAGIIGNTKGYYRKPNRSE